MKLKFNSSILFIIVVILVTAYGIILEQTSKSYKPVDPAYQVKMQQQVEQFISNNSQDQPQVSLSRAYQLFTESKFKQSYRAMLPWAVYGDKSAQLILGYLNQYGLGTEKNEKQAAYWYYAAIDLNQYNRRPTARGLKYMFGLDQHQVDYAQAARWFNMAAQLSDDRY